VEPQVRVVQVVVAMVQLQQTELLEQLLLVVVAVDV
jgi:hypothetical protein